MPGGVTGIGHARAGSTAELAAFTYLGADPEDGKDGDLHFEIPTERNLAFRNSLLQVVAGLTCPAVPAGRANARGTISTSQVALPTI
jgi:hypothetical protein